MTAVTAALGELVEILNDGIEFYRSASEKVSDPQLSDMFLRMSVLKQSIATDLNAEITHGGAPRCDEGSFLGPIRKAYAEVLASLSDENATRYISELEQHEDRLIAAFREAVLGDPSARVRDLALMFYPDVEKMHADMRRLKNHGVNDAAAR